MRVTGSTLLLSKANGPPQLLHEDFSRKRVDARECSGLLLALEEGAHLWILSSDGKMLVRVDLAPGDAVWFDGYVIHAGGAYETANRRVHCYLTGAYANGRARSVTPSLHRFSHEPVEAFAHRVVFVDHA